MEMAKTMSTKIIENTKEICLDPALSEAEEKKEKLFPFRYLNRSFFFLSTHADRLSQSRRVLAAGLSEVWQLHIEWLLILCFVVHKKSRKP